MEQDPRFRNQPLDFWAAVRSISQKHGYAKKKRILVPSVREMAQAFDALGLDSSKLASVTGTATDLGGRLHAYYDYRADTLNRLVEPLLMNAEQAKQLFDKLKAKLNPKCPLPFNKQKGEKKAEAFLTGIVNMLVEANADGLPCDYDPRQLTTVTKDGSPLRTLSRRMDGAFPGPVNPFAVWEVKEYYYTTTFGSRIADGVYETLLDGMELEELRDSEGIDVKHYLMVDAHYTWWECGKSYLCRIVDMTNMGYVDEVLFGQEVETRLPKIVKELVEQQRNLDKREAADPQG